MDKLIVYGEENEKIEFEIANGFVGRVVSAVAEYNIPAAERVAKLLNEDAKKNIDNQEKI